MKKLALITLLLTVSTSYGFTTKRVYECGVIEVYDTITLESSLMPDGNRSFSATSDRYENLEEANCKDLNETWKNYGDDTCYANDKALFSYMGSGKIAMLRDWDKNNMIQFTFCKLTQDIQ